MSFNELSAEQQEVIVAAINDIEDPEMQRLAARAYERLIYLANQNLLIGGWRLRAADCPGASR